MKNEEDKNDLDLIDYIWIKYVTKTMISYPLFKYKCLKAFRWLFYLEGNILLI